MEMWATRCQVLLVFSVSLCFLTSSFFSRLSIRSFLDARLALVYLFWAGRYKTCRKREADQMNKRLLTKHWFHVRMKVPECSLSSGHNSLWLVQRDVYLSVAFLPHLAVGLHAEITVTHSCLYHLHFCCEHRLCLLITRHTDTHHH